MMRMQPSEGSMIGVAIQAATAAAGVEQIRLAHQVRPDVHARDPDLLCMLHDPRQFRVKDWIARARERHRRIRP